MRVVGIDASTLLHEEPTGIEKYVRSLLVAMMKTPLLPVERVRLYAPKPKPESLLLPSGWEWRELRFVFPKGWTHLRLGMELRMHPPSVFFSPAHEIPILTKRSQAVVSTVHDVAFRRAPQTYDAWNRRRQEWAIERVRKHANRILTVSEATRNDLRELFSFDLSRVTVTPLAPTFTKRPTEEEKNRTMEMCRLTEGRYLLFVGRIEEKKNVATLIKAFFLMKDRLGHGHPLQLVLVGNDGFRADEIRALVAQSPYAQDVRFLGYVPDEILPALFAASLAFVFPSVWEGFGLPILEAMAMGAPVIGSDIPVFREIGGEGICLIPPMQVEGFTDAFERLVFDADFRNDFIQKGAKRVAEFTWEKTAQKTWEVLRAL